MGAKHRYVLLRKRIFRRYRVPRALSFCDKRASVFVQQLTFFIAAKIAMFPRCKMNEGMKHGTYVCASCFVYRRSKQHGIATARLRRRSTEAGSSYRREIHCVLVTWPWRAGRAESRSQTVAGKTYWARTSQQHRGEVPSTRYRFLLQTVDLQTTVFFELVALRNSGAVVFYNGHKWMWCIKICDFRPVRRCISEHTGYYGIISNDLE